MSRRHHPSPGNRLARPRRRSHRPAADAAVSIRAISSSAMTGGHRLPSWLPAVITGLVLLVPFALLLWPDDRVIPDNDFCDYGSFQLPIREFARDEILHGRFPLWMPHLGCGMPLHAGQQASLCHPILTPLMLLFGANYGIKLTLFIQLIVAFAGVYLLARALSIRCCGAALAGIVVTLGAFPITHLMEGHVTILLAYALSPWFFLTLVRLLRRPSPRNAVAFALVVACMAVCGHPQIPYYTLLFGSFWAGGSITFGMAARSPLRCLGWCLVGFACGILLAAPQLLPALELASTGISQSDRGTADYASRYALDGADLLRFFVPNALGNPLCGIKSFDINDFFHERIGYIGVLPIFLAALGLVRAPPASWQWGAVCLCLVGLVIALGGNTPVFGGLGAMIPGLFLFRCPGRVLAVVTLMAALLAGRGLDDWTQGEPRATATGRWRLAAPGCAMLLLSVCSGARFIRFSVWSEYARYAYDHLLVEYASAAVVAAASIAFLSSVGRRLTPQWRCWAAIIAVGIDLGNEAVGNFSLESRERTDMASLAAGAHHGSRVVDAPEQFAFVSGSLSASRIVPAVVERGMSSVITNEGGVPPAGLARLHRAIENRPKTALAVSGCNHSLSPLTGVCERLPTSLPRTRLMSAQARKLVNIPIEHITARDVCLMKELLIGDVEVVHEDSQTVALDVTAPADAVFVLADLFYPGWQCEMDGRPVVVSAAHGIFRAVDLPTGKHRLVFRFRSDAFRAGLWACLAGVFVIAVLWFLPARSGRGAGLPRPGFLRGRLQPHAQCALTLISWLLFVSAANAHAPAVNLQETVLPSPIRFIADDAVEIRGTVKGHDAHSVCVRVTNSEGASFNREVPVKEGGFRVRYPNDFTAAPRPLSPGLLYIDATDAPPFGGRGMLDHQAEVLIIVTGKTCETLPDLPAPFTDDLTDAAGRTDTECAQWARHEALVNLFMRSRGAKLAGVGRPKFDIARENDFRWFRGNATLYDFDHRDRDWSAPLRGRVAAGFWQASWNNWFGPTNDHPWDGDSNNPVQSNYRPYAFSCDHADLLILHQMRRSLPRPIADNRDKFCGSALSNLLAMQHRAPTNFALKAPGGKQEQYTAGAFRYGLFETGEWLTEGTGWFVDPRRDDFRGGGVFNGRCVWALGESLKADPHGASAAKAREALGLAVRFCLHDALAHGYARRTKRGNVFWRDAGEHGYLLLGLIAAFEADKRMTVSLGKGEKQMPLGDVCGRALNALVDEARADGGWTAFPDKDAIAIAALSDGARVWPRHDSAGKWLAAARHAADAWLSLAVAAGQRNRPTPHFGFRLAGEMSHFFGDDKRARFVFYVSGHWLQALAKLGRLERDGRYDDRCRWILAYLCGANPFHARIFNEMGAVYNYATDNDADGIEDRLQYDLYPESTAFVQIGLLHYLRPQ